MRIVYFILAIALLSGCERPLSKLAHQVAGADRIVIRDRTAHPHSKLSDFRFSIAGDKVGEVVRAISSAKCLGRAPVTLSIWNWELRFYRGTNFLATVDFQGDVFLVDGGEGGEYCDKSGVLEQLDHTLYIQSKYATAPSNTALEPTPTAP